MLRSFSKIFIPIFVLKNTLVLAQNNNLCGVFLNVTDFKSKQISYTKIVGKKYRFNASNLLSTSIIKITIGDSVYRISKDSVFGYRTMENVCYRLHNNEEYKIINPSEPILIYSKSFFTGYKTNQITRYFFSFSADSKIYPLTKYNLKQVTIGDSLFHNQLDIYFRDDDDLLGYDSFNKIYRLNKLKHK